MIANSTDQPSLMRVGEEPPPLTTAKKFITPAKPPGKPTAAPDQARAKPGSRFAVLNTFVDVTMHKLSRAELTVWLLLFRDTKPNGLARTAQADLARRAGTTTRTVERAIQRLVLRGLLSVVRRGGLRQGPSCYRVHALINELRPPPTEPP